MASPESAVTETVKVISGIEWNRISAQVGLPSFKVPLNLADRTSGSPSLFLPVIL